MCNDCDKYFGSNQAINYHQIIEHQQINLELPCSICDKTFKVEEGLDEHVRSVHTIKHVRCHMCHYKVVHDMDIASLYTRHPDTYEVNSCPFWEDKRTVY